MRNATSVKERLKNYAKKNNRIVQDIFTVYVMTPIDLTDTIETIQKFLNPVVQALREDNSFSGTWDPTKKEWRKMPS